MASLGWGHGGVRYVMSGPWPDLIESHLPCRCGAHLIPRHAGTLLRQPPD